MADFVIKGCDQTCKLDTTITAERDSDTHILQLSGYEGYQSHKFMTRLFVPDSHVDKFHSYLQQQWEMTDAHKVKQFTEESRGTSCPEKPQLMTKEATQFIIKMVLSEMVELAQTVCDKPEDALELVRNCMGTDFNKNYKKPEKEMHLIAEQADAMVDAWYYMLNTGAKHGMNLSRLFGTVHEANMAKRFPDGKFHRRPEDGKIIKPAEWKEPDIVGAMEKQVKEGSW